MTSQRTDLRSARREDTQGDRDATADPASALDMPEPGDVICDRHRRDWYVVTAVDDGAIELRDEGTEYRIPRSLFVSMYGKRLFDGGRTASLDPPEWCTTG